MRTALRKKTSNELKSITDEVVKRTIHYENLKIKQVILFGSYARGTAEAGSDIDIMVLCDNSDDEARKYCMDIFRLADKIAFENDIMIQVDVESIANYNKWVDHLPYFKNIKDEGVLLYG